MISFEQYLKYQYVDGLNYLKSVLFNINKNDKNINKIININDDNEIFYLWSDSGFAEAFKKLVKDKMKAL